MRRMFAVVAMLIAFTGGSSFAQTCPQPTITQIGGTNPICAGQTVALDAGAGWTTYQWSNGATTRTMSDTPAASTVYTVTTTDANGCSITSQPLQVTVTDNPATPDIALREPQLCLYSEGEATTNSQAPSFQWSITGGHFTTGTFPNIAYGTPVRYVSDGGTIVLTLTAWDSSHLCSATTTAQVPLRSVPQPVITTSSPSVCAWANATASVQPPAGGNWASVDWSITNGSFQTTTYPYQSSYASGTDVTFSANGSGPVTLTAFARDSYGCAAPTATKQVTLRTIPAPAITTATTNLCPYASSTASIQPPAEGSWTNVSWNITNGYFPTNQYPFQSPYASGTNVTFASNGNGPVTLTAWVMDSFGCSAPVATKDVTLRSIPAPAITTGTTNLCPYASSTASVQPPAEGNWTNVSWNITNGYFPSNQYPYQLPYASGTNVTFTSNGNGPVTLTAWATDSFGCLAPVASAQVTLRSIPAPTITTAATSVCQYATSTASVQPPAEGSWTNVSWNITNGYFPTNQYPYQSSYASGTNVSFTANGSGPVTLTAWASDSLGCLAPVATKQVTLRTIPQPAIITASPSLCRFATSTASVAPPAEGSWTYISWNITNGSFQTNSYPYQSTSASGPNVTFNADGNGPVTLTVQASDSFGCMAPQATKQVALRTVAAPVITTAASSLCRFATSTASVAPPAEGSWTYISWSITNGFFQSNQYPYQSTSTSGPNVSFTPDGNGPVILTVQGYDSFGCQSPQATTQVALRTIPAPVITTAAQSLCQYATSTASVDPPAEGTWQYISWNITGGTFQTNSYPYQTTYASGPNVTFSADGSGPVTLSAQGYDSLGCQSPSATKQVTLRTIPAPTITSSQPSLCGNLQGDASIAAPADGTWQYVNWSITNGHFQTNSYPYQTTYASGPNVTFSADGTGPVTLTASARDSFGCNAPTATLQVPLRVIAPPQIQVNSQSCPTTATIANATDFTQINWEVGNASVTGDYNSPSLTFQPSGNGVLTLIATGWDANGCSSSSTVNITVSGLPDLTMTLSPNRCVGSPGTASVPDGGPGVTYSWSTGTSGHIIGSATGPSVQFVPDTDTLAITVTAQGASGCTVLSTTHAAVNRPPIGGFESIPASMCANAVATVSTYDNGPTTTYQWTVTDGDIVSGQGTRSISVRAHNSPSVTVRVTKTSSSGCNAIFEQAIAVNSVNAAITPGGPTTFCAGGSVTLTASAGASYLWSNGATTQSIGVSTAGNYSVTVTNASGCSATSAPATVTVNQPPAPTITAGGPTTFCAGGSVTLTASPAASYLWSNGATAQSITATAAGNYSVTVTDANGCTGTSSATAVTVNPLPVATITAGGPTSFCQGGTVTLTANASSSYLWSTGATSQSIVVNASGSYSVTVTNANGCSATSQPTVVTVNPPPTPTLTPDGPTTFCNGGHVTLTASAGSSYQWTTGATTQSITVSSGGTYKAYVTDSNGCGAFTNSVTVVVNTTVRPTITLAGPLGICPGTNVTLTASAGSAYHWSTGATTQSITVSAAGSYTVDVTDANGCTLTSNPTNISLNAEASVNISINGPTTFCAPGSVSFLILYEMHPDGPYTYRWSTGETTNQITVTQSGSYAVTVTNAYGCTKTMDPIVVTVNDPRKPTVAVNGPTTLCTTSGQTTTLRASDGAASYHWYSGEQTQQITVSAGGIYRVIATYPDGCQRTSDPVVINEDSLWIQPSGPTTFCTGSVTLTAQSGATSFLWSNGATTPSITVSNSGTYGVTATFADGCTMTASQAVASSNDFSVSATPPMPRDGNVLYNIPTYVCPGHTMHYTANVSGGRPPYTYQWYRGDLDLIQGATSATYDTTEQSVNFSVLVTDSGGCMKRSNFTQEFAYTVANAGITAFGPTTFCAGGSVSLRAYLSTPTDGLYPISYLWSTGETTQSITATAPGSYSVTVTDNYGCATVAPPVVVSVNPLPPATVTPSGPTTFCAGGSVTLSAPAGYSYSWSNGATTRSINVTSSGSYRVTVTDANGCSALSASVPVTVNSLPPATISANGPTTFCAGGTVRLTAPAGYSYAWSNGATMQSIDVTSSGSYSVAVTNASGCSTTSASTSVIVNPLPTPAITAGGPTTFCAGGSVTLTSSAASGYLWSNGATTQSIVVSASGNYSVTITNASGCSATSASTAVTVNPLPTPAITAGGPTTFCAGGSVTLTSSAATGYLWSTGATTQSIAVNATGNYSVTVTDANGCSAVSAAVSVTRDPDLDKPTITSGPTSICPGGSVAMTAHATGGSGVYSYQWYHFGGTAISGATSQTYTVSPASNDSYYVDVTDSLGCHSTSSDSVIVTVNPSPDATITAPAAICAGSNGSASVPDAGAGATYNWTITNGAIDSTMSGGTAAVFHANAGATAVTLNITVTTGAGCSTSSAAATVTVNPTPTTPSITADGPTTFCSGGSVTLTAPAGYTYAWSNGATTQSIHVTAAGSYGVTVTNASGCSAASVATTVTVNSNPSTPTISAGGPTTFCAGGNVTLTAPAGYTYAWSNGATTQSIVVSASGSFSVAVMNANGCSATSAATSVTVNPNPATPTITAGGPTTFCAGGSVTLTAPAGYTYAWSNGATTQSIVVSASGSFSVTVTNANGCATTSTATSVTVNPNPATPTITAGGPTTFCAGGNVTLTAPTGYTYAWSNGATTQSIVVSASGSFSVTMTNANGCAATSAATSVTVNPNPTTPTISAGGPTTFCAGGNVTLTAPVGYTYAWSNGATTQSIVVTASGSYSVTVTNANGCGATSAATSVTVNPNPATPAITAGGPTTFCAGGNVTLTAPVGYTYAWSNGATTQSIVVNASGSYSVTVTNANGCSATSAATNVTVNAKPATPAITAGGPTTFCAGGTVTLTAPTGFTYAWSNGATTQSIVVSVSGSYSVTVTNANGCSATSAATTVTVNAKPATPAITAGGPTTFCAGGSVTLTAPAGYTYAWSTGATSQSIVASASGNYTVTVTNASGCNATSTATTVTVNSNPATPTITAGGATTFCPGGSVTLTAPAGFTYSWSNGATTQSINVTTSGSYTVTVANASGCTATSAPTAVTVKPATQITSQPSPATQTVVRNQNATITVGASGSGALTYQWFQGNAGVTTTPVGVNSNQLVISKNTKGTFKYWVRVTAGCGTANSTTATVVVN
jgi:D-lyxose ketol-isomerase